MTAEQLNNEYKDLKDDEIIIQTIEGVFIVRIPDLLNQPIEGVLYDLNRDEATTYAIEDERMINDIAVAKIIRYLHKYYKSEIKTIKHEI